MSEFEKQKNEVKSKLRQLCAHCSNEAVHSCKLNSLLLEVDSLSGVPLVVNDRFKGVLFPN